jgi:Domain of unknown function (DUF1707)
MSPQPSPPWLSNPPWAGGSHSRRRGTAVNPDLRASDAERADVADRLSKHYGDGRLDQAEFNERMERAMNAKTHGDFGGLFADLPDLTEPDAKSPVATKHPPTHPPARSPMYRFVLLILIVVAAALLGQALVHSFFPWLLLGIVAFLWLRNNPRHNHHA